MTSWILLAVGLVSAALGLLTVFRSPDWIDWRLPVAVDQFGYVIAVVPLATVLLAVFLPASRGAPAAAACLAGAAGFALLVQPCVQAWFIGRGLPQRLEAQFGQAAIQGPAFSFSGLFRRFAKPLPKATWTYSGDLQLDFYAALGRSPRPA